MPAIKCNNELESIFLQELAKGFNSVFQRRWLTALLVPGANTSSRAAQASGSSTGCPWGPTSRHFPVPSAPQFRGGRPPRSRAHGTAAPRGLASLSLRAPGAPALTAPRPAPSSNATALLRPPPHRQGALAPTSSQAWLGLAA